MSFMHFDATAAATEQTKVYTLTTSPISAYDPYYAQAGLRIYGDGRMFKRVNYNLIQISSLTDWVIPRDDFPADAGLYQARCILTSSVGGLKPGSETFGTSWIVLTAGGSSSLYLEWAVDMYRLDAGGGAFTFDIRYGDGTDPVNTELSLHDGSSPCVASQFYLVTMEAN